MKSQTLLAFDYGEKSIGVAVGRSSADTVRGVAAVRVHHGRPDWDHIDRLVEEWQPAAFVVGLPLNMDASETGLTPVARKFGNRLRGRYNRPVHMVDERLTTRVAKQELAEAGIAPTYKNKARIDRLAAERILQDYLHARGRESA